MIVKLLAASAVVATLTAFAPVARAGSDFSATPLQAGPPKNLPGETLIPGAARAIDVIDGLTQPLLQPILAPGAVAEAPSPQHHHHLAGAHHASAHHGWSHHAWAHRHWSHHAAARHGWSHHAARGHHPHVASRAHRAKHDAAS